MKRFLRWFLNFLERKFPDKVVVTADNYRALLDTLRHLSDKVQKQEENIVALEHNVLNVNQAMGMTIPKMGLLER